MSVNQKMVNYSKIYWKDLTDLSFKNALNSKNNARTEAFLPLYSAINKNYGFINNPERLAKVASYLSMLSKQEEFDHILSKFSKSMDAYYYMKSKEILIKQKISKKIQKAMNNNELSSYRLNKEFGINLKICSQLKNGKKVSLSLLSLMDLSDRIDSTV